MFASEAVLSGNGPAPAGLATQALSSAYAAARTLSYAVGYRLMGFGIEARTPAQQRSARRHLKEAFLLQRDMLRRPGMAQVLWAAERQDLAHLPAFLATLPFDLRRMRQRAQGVQRPVQPRDDFDYPVYYLHDYHYQANGALSWRAAATYEWQIRFLFAGTNRLMRQAVIDAIPPGKHLNILDVGCGTGTWARQARLQGRNHPICGVDLSPHYLRVARGRNVPDTTYEQHNAETLPKSWSERFDVVTCIWMYHELPRAAQRQVTANIARVLKPGGTLLFLEAAQQCDVPEDDISDSNRAFADNFNEPYFMAYQKLDLEAHLRDAGLTVGRRQRSFVSTLIEATKHA